MRERGGRGGVCVCVGRSETKVGRASLGNVMQLASQMHVKALLDTLSFNKASG